VEAPACIGRGFFFGSGWVNIRFCGGCGWRFRPYGESLWQTPQRNQRSGPRRSARSLGLGVPSLRDSSGGIASGLLRCTSSRWVWLSQTLASLPPPDKSLHSACRWGQHGKIKSCSRACAHPVEWGGFAAWAAYKLNLWERACSRWRPVNRPISSRLASVQPLTRSHPDLGKPWRRALIAT
jgi:hypothetical protein